MDDLKTLLESKNISTALIIDDTFDDVPSSEELGDIAIATFADDVEPDQLGAPQTIEAALTRDPVDALRDKDVITWLWTNRARIPDAQPLFRDYERGSLDDRRFLDALLRSLEGFGLNCTTAGRNFVDKAIEPDLIFIDLFLSKRESAEDIEIAKTGLRDAFEARGANPPAVVLMSRNTQLETQRIAFRDDVGVFEAAFRVVSKQHLEEGEMLEATIRRLADSYEEAKTIAGFLTALETGTAQAVADAISLFKKLSLADLSNVRALRLKTEQAPLGSYFVDLFDRVIQYEIEGQEAIIDAACKLNVFDLGDVAPRHISDSPALQELINRTLSQNPKRLQMPQTIDSNVMFADVLRLSAADTVPAMNIERDELVGVNMFVVVTPACDLQRGGAETVLLLPGNAVLLDVQVRAVHGRDLSTQSLRIGEQTYRITWRPKGVISIPASTLTENVANGNVSIIARLRDTHAAALARRVLDDLGRIGEMVTSPVTFKVGVRFFYLDPQCNYREIPSFLPNREAIIYVSDKKRLLSLREPDVDALFLSLTNLDDTAGHPAALVNRQTMRANQAFRKQLVTGLNVLNLPPGTNSWKDVPDTNSLVKYGRSGSLIEEQADNTLRKTALFMLIEDTAMDVVLAEE